MLTQADREIAREFQRRLEVAVPVLDLRVFGSRARGEATFGSDMDVFIEVEEVTPALRRQIEDIAWEVGFDLDCVITTIVATRDQVKHGPLGASPLVLNIEREGVRP